jgi:murein DD-endopeptidase MepM/ murein hydrolase activator NlpD
MTLAEALGRLNVLQEPIPFGHSNRPGTPITPRFITIHNTDNAGRGADARAHGRYLLGADARRRRVSWHYTVDDRCVVQSLPASEVGWHAATGAGNASSVGVEICMHQGIDEAAANDRAALLAAYLGRTLGIALPDGLKQHHDWSGKNCPSVIRSRRSGWADFRRAAAEHWNALTAPSGRGAAAVTSAPATGASRTGVRARRVPPGDPVPFAASPVTVQRFWPIVTNHPQALVVSCETASGETLGAASRRFLADRRDGQRHHVGIDLFAHAGDEVVACEDGRVVAFYRFYQRSSTQEWTHALLIEHAGFVMNYGEVAENSLAAYGLRAGDAVRAGQKIGRVSGTAMLHCETFARGTTANVRWPVGARRPAALLDPTQCLLDLSVQGLRLSVGGTARPVDSAEPDAPGVPVNGTVVAIPSRLPALATASWHNQFEGREWRYDERGVYTRDRGEGRTPWRSPGEPVTMRRIWQLMGEPILEYAAKHGVHPALVLMTIATETAMYRNVGFTGPKTFRWEGHVVNGDVRPPFAGTYSAGPMQTLATTVRDTLRRLGSRWQLRYRPETVAPAIRSRPEPPPDAHPLYDYATNIDLGCAEIRSRWARSGADPILVAAAYNTGGLYAGPAPWRLRAYGDHLDRAAQWYGDACAVLREVGVV